MCVISLYFEARISLGRTKTPAGVGRRPIPKTEDGNTLHKRILITGGAGFIGSHAAEAFLAAGWKVRVLDDLSSGKRRNLLSLENQANFEFVQGSAVEPAIVDSAINGVDIVVHLAALVSVGLSIERPRESLMNNVIATFNVFDACRRNVPQCPLIYASSAAVYGAASKTPIVETDRVLPMSPYAADKLYAENLASAFYHAHGLHTVGFRFFNVYGPRQDPTSPYSGVITKFKAALQGGQPCTIFGDGLQTRDFVHVADVTSALVLAAARLHGEQNKHGAIGAEIYNLGSGHSISIKELHALMAKTYDGAALPLMTAPLPGDVRDSCADIRAITARLLWLPTVDLQRGLSQRHLGYCSN